MTGPEIISSFRMSLLSRRFNPQYKQSWSGTKASVHRWLHNPRPFSDKKQKLLDIVAEGLIFMQRYTFWILTHKLSKSEKMLDRSKIPTFLINYFWSELSHCTCYDISKNTKLVKIGQLYKSRLLVSNLQRNHTK